jgi:hypothetical protein
MGAVFCLRVRGAGVTRLHVARAFEASHVVIVHLLWSELPGLRWFSEGAIKKMRLFYEEWNAVFTNRSLMRNDLNQPQIAGAILGNSDTVLTVLTNGKVLTLSRHSFFQRRIPA